MLWTLKAARQLKYPKLQTAGDTSWGEFLANLAMEGSFQLGTLDMSTVEIKVARLIFVSILKHLSTV